MKHLIILIAAFALLGCTKEATVMEVAPMPDCTIEVVDHTYECDEEDRIQLTPIENGVKINTVAVNRINIYHNAVYHSAIITNGNICHNRSVASTRFEEGDTLTVGIDGKYAKELIIEIQEK